MSRRCIEIEPGVFRDCADNVVVLASEKAVDEAWDGFSALAARLPDHPELLADRAFMESLTRAEARWKRLFLMQEGGRCS